jgi:Rieske Fe-S protein
MVRGEETPVTRRAALMGAAGLAVGAVGAAVAGRLGGEPTAAPPPPGPAAGIVRPIPGWTRVAAFATLPEDGPVKVVAGTVTAYLFRTGEHVRAVSAICSDLPCALDWRGDSDSLYCPCHRALFTAQGKSLSDIYPVPPLATYEVKVEGGDVYLKAP